MEENYIVVFSVHTQRIILLYFGKYTVKYLGGKRHYIYNLLPKGPEKNGLYVEGEERGKKAHMQMHVKTLNINMS